MQYIGAELIGFGETFFALSLPTPAKPALSDATRIFGERVLARRTELGLSQERAADLIGLHWTYVGQVERGQRNLTLHNILKFAEGLGIDAGKLVSGLPVPSK